MFGFPCFIPAAAPRPRVGWDAHTTTTATTATATAACLDACVFCNVGRLCLARVLVVSSFPFDTHAYSSYLFRCFVPTPTTLTQNRYACTSLLSFHSLRVVIFHFSLIKSCVGGIPVFFSLAFSPCFCVDQSNRLPSITSRRWPRAWHRRGCSQDGMRCGEEEMRQTKGRMSWRRQSAPISDTDLFFFMGVSGMNVSSSPSCAATMPWLEWGGKEAHTRACIQCSIVIYVLTALYHNTITHSRCLGHEVLQRGHRAGGRRVGSAV